MQHETIERYERVTAIAFTSTDIREAIERHARAIAETTAGKAEVTWQPGDAVAQVLIIEAQSQPPEVMPPDAFDPARRYGGEAWREGPPPALYSESPPQRVDLRVLGGSVLMAASQGASTGLAWGTTDARIRPSSITHWRPHTPPTAQG